MTDSTDILQAYEAGKKDRPAFNLRPGFEVRVHSKLREGGKERTQVFEGIVTAIAGSGLGRTFTVRRLAEGTSVERIFPMFSPLVTDVDVIRATKVRRAKLTYLRNTETQQRKREDARLMRRVEAERAAKQHAKEEAERHAREERGSAERAAKDTAEKKSAEEAEKENSQ